MADVAGRMENGVYLYSAWAGEEPSCAVSETEIEYQERLKFEEEYSKRLEERDAELIEEMLLRDCGKGLCCLHTPLQIPQDFLHKIWERCVTKETPIVLVFPPEYATSSLQKLDSLLKSFRFAQRIRLKYQILQANPQKGPPEMQFCIVAIRECVLKKPSTWQSSFSGNNKIIGKFYHALNVFGIPFASRELYYYHVDPNGKKSYYLGNDPHNY